MQTFRTACNTHEGILNQVNFDKINYSILHARKLHKELHKRLFYICNYLIIINEARNSCVEVESNLI